MPPFDWNQFLTLARTLSENADEASLRSAVSRAYYCAFNTAMARAEAAGYRAKGDARAGCTISFGSFTDGIPMPFARKSPFWGRE